MTGQNDAHVHDAIIIGGGLTGIQALWSMRQEGLRVRLLEAGSGAGGVWHWNRYPGARLDSESFSYGFQFDDELLKEWSWSEYFVGQPELESYFNHTVDKHDLRKDMQFNTRVVSGAFDEQTNLWTLETNTGETFRSRLILAATGILSIPNYPPFPGRETFAGEIYHTGAWPKDDVDFTGKRVAVIGTGASGTQVIPHVAATADHLTVFQRTPNWAIPLRNRPITPAEMDEIRANYPEMFKLTASTYSGFVHNWDPTVSTSVPLETRMANYEARWQRPGFAKWFGLYHDIMLDPEVNREYCEFIAAKIRERVKDPKTAEKLIPTDHLFGTKRVPAETNYFEVYNQPNVDLVDLREEPVQEITPTGIRTAQGEREFDMIVFATGFDAFTGSLMRIDLRGVGGQTIQQKWAEGPKTYLGIQVAGFPNLFVLGGPHGKGGIGNAPRAIEPVHEFITHIVRAFRDQGIQRWEADPVAEKEWTEKVLEDGDKSIGASTKSFFYGDNVEGKPRVYLVYVGSLPDFADKLKELERDGYPGFIITPSL